MSISTNNEQASTLPLLSPCILSDAKRCNADHTAASNELSIDAINKLVTSTPTNVRHLLSSQEASTTGRLSTHGQTTFSMRKLGDYVLSEPSSSASNTAKDSFQPALNIKTNELFFWKRFNKSDYMNKLRAYWLMDDCKQHIYCYEHLVHDDDGDDVYALFRRHFGNLHTYMKERRRIGEPEAKRLFRQIARAVDECHRRGIIVQDIKLKKFYFLDAQRTRLVLAELEDSLVLTPSPLPANGANVSDLIRSQRGCPAYVSPEVIDASHTSYSGRLSDSWSCGIVLYALLFGRYPFYHTSIKQMFLQIRSGKFQLPPAGAPPVSLDARLLIASLIRVNASERLLPSEMFASNWLKTDHSTAQCGNRLFIANQMAHNKRRLMNEISILAASRLHAAPTATITTTTTTTTAESTGLRRLSHLAHGHDTFGDESSPSVEHANKRARLDRVPEVAGPTSTLCVGKKNDDSMVPCV